MTVLKVVNSCQFVYVHVVGDPMALSGAVMTRKETSDDCESMAILIRVH
jgi:hypothetical protein